MFDDPLIPSNLTVTNIDISKEAIDWFLTTWNLQKVKNEHRVEFLQMDACKMDFADSSFSVIFDKGTLDALLSGYCEDRVTLMLQETYRVLKPNGKFLLISGNDSSVLNPHLYAFDWAVERVSVERIKRKLSKEIGSRPNVAFPNLPISLHILSKV